MLLSQHDHDHGETPFCIRSCDTALRSQTVQLIVGARDDKALSNVRNGRGALEWDYLLCNPVIAVTNEFSSV